MGVPADPMRAALFAEPEGVDAINVRGGGRRETRRCRRCFVCLIFGVASGLGVPVRGAATDASLGETYALEPYAWAGRREPAGLEGRFSHVLTRARSTGGATALLDIIDAPFPLGPSRARAVYALHVDDDLGFDAAEFADGLAAVLSEAAGNLFASKRICALGTPAGHLTLGRDYLKVVERGREVRRVALPDEAAWREALSTYFGIVLRRVAPVRAGKGA